MDDATGTVAQAVFRTTKDTSRLPGPPGGLGPAVGYPPRPLQRPPRGLQVQRPSEAGAC